MIGGEFTQTLYKGKELKLIEAAISKFHQVESQWHDQYPKNPMTIREMSIENFHGEQESAVVLDIQIVGLKCGLSISIDEMYYGGTFLLPEATYTIVDKGEEYVEEFDFLIAELASRLNNP